MTVGQLQRTPHRTVAGTLSHLGTHHSIKHAVSGMCSSLPMSWSMWPTWPVKAFVAISSSCMKIWYAREFRHVETSQPALTKPAFRPSAIRGTPDSNCNTALKAHLQPAFALSLVGRRAAIDKLATQRSHGPSYTLNVIRTCSNRSCRWCLLADSSGGRCPTRWKNG